MRYLHAVSGAHLQVLPGQSCGFLVSCTLRQAQRRVSHPFLRLRWSLSRHPLWLCECVAVPRRMQSVDMEASLQRRLAHLLQQLQMGATCSACALLICPRGSAAQGLALRRRHNYSGGKASWIDWLSSEPKRISVSCMSAALENFRTSSIWPEVRILHCMGLALQKRKTGCGVRGWGQNC